MGFALPSPSRPLALALFSLSFGTQGACLPAPATKKAEPRQETRPSPALEKERVYQARFAQTPIALSASVVDAKGRPLVGAELSLLDGESGAALAKARSDASGLLRLTGLARRNAFLVVSLEGYYKEWIPVALHRSLEESELEVGVVQLIERAPERMRLTFSGDVMFGRRYYDRDEDGVLGEPQDLLFLGAVEQGTSDLFRYMRGYLLSDDHTSINLETTLLESELNGHPINRIVFHSKAQSAKALRPAGVDSVSLGNNHIFDYLEAGVKETIEHLDEVKMPWFGAGLDLSRARASRLRVTKGELNVAMQGFSNLTGFKLEDPKLRLMATDDPPKAGGLAAWASELKRFVQSPELSQDLVIPIIHGGSEYLDTPSVGIQEDLELSVSAGADLVVAHHPHVPSGVWRYSKGEHSALMLGSLGNFVFDQLKFETFSSYLAVVDLVRVDQKSSVERISLVPFAIQDFVPRPITSYAAQSLGRKVAALSGKTKMPAKAGWEATGLSFRQGRFWVQDPKLAPLLPTAVQAPRSVKLAAGLSSPIDLRGEHGKSLSFLSRISSDVSLRCHFGRDLLVGLGRFEDSDVDAQVLEGDGWEWSEYRFVQGHETKHGSGAAALIRNEGQERRVRLPFRSTVPIRPELPLSLHGWQRGEQSGKLEASLRWRAQSGVGLTDEEKEMPLALSDHWSQFSLDLSPPAESVGLRLAFYLEPNSAKAPSTRYLDDLSLIEWSQEKLQVGPQGVEFEAAQGWEFVRCEVPASGASLSLSFRG